MIGLVPTEKKRQVVATSFFADWNTRGNLRALSIVQCLLQCSYAMLFCGFAFFCSFFLTSLLFLKRFAFFEVFSGNFAFFFLES